MLSAEDVSVRFRKGFRRKPIQALNGLTLAVRPGDFLALIGENGAGKSTAMYCFLGLIRPNRGRVLLLGERPTPGSALFGRIGYLPEEPHYHLYLTVAEAVAYYAALSGTRVSPQQIAQILERLGLAEFRDLRLSKCSKGMKQKVGIAQCLLHAPSLLFLDEPMRGLDPIIVREFRQILADLHRGGVTIVMNSHMLPEVEALATHVAILDRGKVVAEGAIGDFTRGDPDIYLVEFERGESEIPLFLTVQAQTDGAIRGTIPAEAFHAFHEYARTQGLCVLSCVLKRRSLEESFVSILGKAGPDA
jgi:ABC-type multidrug transport system ATPase subunit